MKTTPRILLSVFVLVVLTGNRLIAAEQQLETLPKHTYVVVPYPELRQDPASVLRTIYERFDIPSTGGSPTPPPQKVTSNYKSRHTYSLEEFSLREDDIRAELSPIFQRYGF